MLSGTGSGDHPRKPGIEPLIDMKGVGRNLQNHFACTVQVLCPQPIATSASSVLNLVGSPVHVACDGGGLIRCRGADGRHQIS
jgi:choline dehydrogenase-like flavoprotein